MLSTCSLNQKAPTAAPAVNPEAISPTSNTAEFLKLLTCVLQGLRMALDWTWWLRIANIKLDGQDGSSSSFTIAESEDPRPELPELVLCGAQPSFCKSFAACKYDSALAFSTSASLRRSRSLLSSAMSSCARRLSSCARPCSSCSLLYM